MKKIVRILVILLMVFLFVGCSQSKKYTYEVKNHEIVISEYTGASDYVIVPSEVDGNKIKVIGYNTYAYNIYIYHVRLSENIRDIKGCSFWYCTNLTSIYIPSSVEKIEEYAFYNCTSLTNVYFEASENNLEIGEHNDWFKDANITYNVSVEDYERAIGAKE